MEGRRFGTISHRQSSGWVSHRKSGGWVGHRKRGISLRSGDLGIMTILDPANPNAKLNRAAGAINRAVRYRVVTRTVLPVIARDVGGFVPALEEGERHPGLLAGHNGVHLRTVVGVL